MHPGAARAPASRDNMETKRKKKGVTLMEEGVHQEPILGAVCHRRLAAQRGGAWSARNSVDSERRVLKLQSS